MDAFVQPGFNYILFATCEISNYVVGIPIQKANAVTIAQALLNRIVYQFGHPKTLIIDEDRTLSADVLMHIYDALNIRSQVNFSNEPWVTKNRKVYMIYQ